MNAVRNFFGVLLLAMAIWLISPLIPAGVAMALWAALLIVTAIFMHALDALPPHSGRWPKFWKGIGVVALVFGVTLIIGAVSGARSPLQPLAGFGASTSMVETAALPFQRVKNVAEVERIVQQAGKPVMLDFYADWCVACKELEQYTFSNPQVQQALNQFILLQADVTGNTEDDLALLKRFGLFGPPGIIFFDSQGREQPLRIIGFQDADAFLKNLEKLDLK